VEEGVDVGGASSTIDKCPTIVVTAGPPGTVGVITDMTGMIGRSVGPGRCVGFIS
jgi:hypothetical protein